MKRQTRPLQVKTATQTPGDNPTLSIALWVIGGFILVGTAIFILILSTHL
jgi:hypothetical protein